MKIQLIEGNFEAKEALDILTKLIHVKIKYNEDKINNSINYDEIELRLNRIKRLQKNLFDIKKHIDAQEGKITVQSSITI